MMKKAIDVSILLICLLVFSFVLNQKLVIWGVIHTLPQLMILIVYLFYSIISLFFFVLDWLLPDKVPILTPRYSKKINKSDIIVLISTFLIFAILTAMGYSSSIRIQFEPKIVENVLLNGLKAIIENKLFIASIGFSLYGLLGKNKQSLILTSLIVGFLATLWHMGVISITKTYLGVEQAMVKTILTFVFFSVGTYVSIKEDSTFTWDAVHSSIDMINTVRQGVVMIVA